MLYRATYYSARDPQTGATTFETRILPSLRAVELWAESLLKGVRVKTTRDRYWQDVSRAPSVTWIAVKGWSATDPTRGVPSRHHGEILPETTLVPSAGELGYW